MKVITYRAAYADICTTLCEQCADKRPPFPLGPVEHGAHEGRCDSCDAMCHYCAQVCERVEEIADGTIEAHWVDTDGAISDETYLVCGDCYAAGCPTGPGYLTPDKARDLRAYRDWDSQA